MTIQAIRHRERVDVRQLVEAAGVYLAIVVLMVFNLAFTPHFATVGNLRLQLVQVAPVAIVAIGMTLVIATEGIDLSVGSTMAFGRPARSDCSPA